MSGSVLVLVPTRDLRSVTIDDKRRSFATIHTGKYQVIGEAGEDGTLLVTREAFDESFRIIEPDEQVPAEPADRLAEV
jgi:hypothetical protein